MAIIERMASHQGWPLRGVPLYNLLFSPLPPASNPAAAIVGGIFGALTGLLIIAVVVVLVALFFVHRKVRFTIHTQLVYSFVQ